VTLLICRLEKSHITAAFDCGDRALNDYLRVYAWQNQQRYQVGITYDAADESKPEIVIGYYTLAMSEIPSGSSVPEALKHLPYPTMPAILLARLAVD
jgi:hypothetical protein